MCSRCIRKIPPLHVDELYTKGPYFFFVNKIPPEATTDRQYILVHYTVEHIIILKDTYWEECYWKCGEQY